MAACKLKKGDKIYVNYITGMTFSSDEHGITWEERLSNAN